VELVYGVAPEHRGHGHASRAARLAARWLLDEGLAREVELRIGEDHVESQRVAGNAGFALAGMVVSRAVATGEPFHDLRYVMFRPDPRGPHSEFVGELLEDRARAGFGGATGRRLHADPFTGAVLPSARRCTGRQRVLRP
jgi:hypothetical protein